MKISAFSDKILYLRLQDKDKEAFIKAYDLYLDSIYRFIFFKVGNREEAEDLTSSVFLKAWDYIQTNKIKEFKTLKSLLYKIARNAVIDHYRKQSKRQEISLDQVEEAVDIIDEKFDLIGELELAAEWRELEKKLCELKDEYREIILLKYVDELSIAEIAKVLNKSQGNVRVLIFRAVSALKKIAEVEEKK
ncbi:MAG: ECF RNA polymerase sigma factor SigW [Parcubacteria group bacterium ADurb.Bin316]|nr:MAG: ECF RNA polymerase sigma factor SigW [Parcubacteria group bacterium ADurb.Bin316]HOZ56117.1 RNA polymerase sigma factor [bacterium]